MTHTKGTTVRKIALSGVGIACAALAFAPTATADPTSTSQYVITHSQPMRCWVRADDSDEGVGGPVVICQNGAGFPQAPMDPPPPPGWVGDPSVWHQDQAIVYASGQFNWRTANLGSLAPGQANTTLVDGQTYHMQGWTILPTSDGTRFTNDGTGHGMFIGSDSTVNPF
jgi:hypothetical protein